MEEFCEYKETYSEDQKKKIAEEFRRLEGQYYLEHAGATLYSEKQLEQITWLLSKNLYANPHARNLSSKVTEDAVDIIRFQILSHFKSNPEEYSVIFTSGATAALKLIGENFSYGNVDGSEHGTLIYLQDNHTSVLGMRSYAKSFNCINYNEALTIFSQKKYQRGWKNSNSLFVYPAQSNFSGIKYPTEWIEKTQNGALNHFTQTHCKNWFVALDAASFVSTNVLNLSKIKPDFVTISFYKIFGYPTGVGALLVKNSSADVLKKKYFGGGTVFMAQSCEKTVFFRDSIHERFEDGTLPFLSILALKQGFETFERLNLNLELISSHTFNLACYVYRNLRTLRHTNNNPICILYHDTNFENLEEQGGIVNFNLLRDNGDYVGYSEVLHFANLFGIHLRTGCFCNPGACQHFLKLSSEDVKRHFEAGHVCGDQHDLVNGYPTGSVRISFGYMSTKKDADRLLEMVQNCFTTQPSIKKLFIPKSCNYNNYNNNNLEQHFQWENSSLNPCKVGFLQRIFLYPVKSCGAFSVCTEWPITSTGLKYDRQWMIVNSAGVCITQKHNKRICLIRPIIDLETQNLYLTFAEHNKIAISLENNCNIQSSASLCQSKICGDKIQGWDCGDEVADWLVEILESPGLRLLKQCSETEENRGRISRQNEHLQLSLVNKAQYLLVNVASVKWLRRQIVDDQFDETLETTILRFRPNLLVDLDTPFVENQIEEFWFENHKFESGGKCTRCQMICIDQTTGVSSKEPLQTLSKEFHGKIAFGVYLNQPENKEGACLRIGCQIIGRNL